MWSVLLRAIPYVLAGVGLSDIATDWFRKRPEGSPKPSPVNIIKANWIGYLVTSILVVMILKYTNLLKKRL